MATEAQLRRRIRELQEEIDNLSRHRADAELRMSHEMTARYERLRKELEREIARQTRATEAEYAKRIRVFQEQIRREMNAEYAALKRETDRVAADQARKLEELTACNEELRGMLKSIKAHEEMVDVSHRSYAEMLYEQLKENRRATQTSPHEFFFKGEFDIIDSHASQVPEEIKMEMYQAAAADASGVTMEFDLLRTKVEQALNEWILAFQDYARSIRSIQAGIDFLEKHQIHTAAGTFLMGQKELDFWSSGSYLPFKEKIESAAKVIDEVERIGVIEYLKKNSGQQRKEIFARCKEAKKWEDELHGITNCILSERILSDERWFLAKTIDEMLRKIGYGLVEKGFRKVDEETASKEWYPKQKAFQCNPLDCYDLAESIQGKDILRITLVPVRENGISVHNECIISLDAKTMKDSELTTSIITANISRVKALAPDLSILGIQTGDNQAERKMMEEKQRKKEPSPAEQIKSLEKKYK